MATLLVDVGSPYSPGTISLCVALAGNGPTTNVIDRGARTGPVLLEVITTVGATPTCTYLVEGSVDAVNFFAIPHADPASPGTFGVATFGPVTSATTTRRIVQAGQPWRVLRVTMSANTNVTNTINAYVF